MGFRRFTLIFLTLLLGWQLSFAQANTTPGADLRSFLHKVIASGEEDPSMRAFILRNAIAQNAHLLPLLTSREKAFQLLQEADLAFAIHQATDLPTVGDEAARRLRPRIQKLVEQFEVGREISDEDLQYVYNFIRKKSASPKRWKKRRSFWIAI